MFYFLDKLKQRSSDVTGQHQRPVDSDVTEGVITTRSNRMKFWLCSPENRVISVTYSVAQKYSHNIKLATQDLPG